MMLNNTNVTQTSNIKDENNLTDIDYASFFSSVIIFLPTVTGNSLVLISLYRFRELRTSMGILIGSLAVSDLLVGVVLLPVEVSSVLVGVYDSRYKCLSKIGISVTLTCASVMNMLAISIERFMSVTFPLQHRTSKTKTATKVAILFIWISAPIFGFLPLMGLHKPDYNNHCMYNKVFLTEYTVFITSFLAACIIANIVLFSLVIRIAFRKLHGARGSQTEHKHVHISKNLAKTYVMMAVSAAFVVCWGPFSVLTVIGLVYQWESYPIALRWSYFLGIMNSGINWMIYGFKNPKFRKAIKAVACKESTFNPYASESSE